MGVFAGGADGGGSYMLHPVAPFSTVARGSGRSPGARVFSHQGARLFSGRRLVSSSVSVPAQTEPGARTQPDKPGVLAPCGSGRVLRAVAPREARAAADPESVSQRGFVTDARRPRGARPLQNPGNGASPEDTGRLPSPASVPLQGEAPQRRGAAATILPSDGRTPPTAPAAWQRRVKRPGLFGCIRATAQRAGMTECHDGPSHGP